MTAPVRLIRRCADVRRPRRSAAVEQAPEAGHEELANPTVAWVMLPSLVPADVHVEVGDWHRRLHQHEVESGCDQAIPHQTRWRAPSQARPVDPWSSAPTRPKLPRKPSPAKVSLVPSRRFTVRCTSAFATGWWPSKEPRLVGGSPCMTASSPCYGLSLSKVPVAGARARKQGPESPAFGAPRRVGSCCAMSRSQSQKAGRLQSAI